MFSTIACIPQCHPSLFQGVCVFWDQQSASSSFQCGVNSWSRSQTHSSSKAIQLGLEPQSTTKSHLPTPSTALSGDRNCGELAAIRVHELDAIKERRSKYWDRQGGEEDNKGGAKEWSHHQHQKQYAQPQTVEKKDSVDFDHQSAVEVYQNTWQWISCTRFKRRRFKKERYVNRTSSEKEHTQIYIYIYLFIQYTNGGYGQ